MPGSLAPSPHRWCPSWVRSSCRQCRSRWLLALVLQCCALVGATEAITSGKAGSLAVKDVTHTQMSRPMHTPTMTAQRHRLR